MPIYTFICVYFRYHQNTAGKRPAASQREKRRRRGSERRPRKKLLMEAQTKALTNRPLPDGTEERLRSRLEDGERLLFTVVCDLSPAGSYDDSLLAVTDRRVLYTEEDGGFAALPYTEIEEAAVKRMYGNARLTIRKKSGGTIRAVRFTYAVASLCDMAAAFINNVAGGCSPDSELPAAEAAFDRMKLVCPKCGRRLIREGAECIRCQSKGKIVSKLWKYVAPEKKPLIVSLIMSIITTAMALLPPFITKMLVDEIIPNSDKKMLVTVVLSLLGAYFIQHAVGALRGYILRIAGDRIVLHLRNDVYLKAQYLPMKFYDKTSTGSVINRISGDTATLQAFILRITQEVIVQFFMLVGIVVIMFALEWRLTLLSLLPVPAVVIGVKIFGRKIAPFYKRIWRRWAAVTSVLTDSIPCIRVIKSFAGEKRAVRRFEKYNEEWLKVDVKSARITSVYPYIVGFVVTCGSLLIWSVGGGWVIDDPSGPLSLGLRVSFISYASMFYGPVNFFAYLSDSYQSALAAAERILDILDAEPEQSAEDGLKPDVIRGRIEFRNVSFSFDRTKKVLSDVSVTIEPGDIVGIVGTTGSGKSTLINLLMKFYDGYEGEILVDGIDIRNLDTGHFRSKIGYVQQEPMMFSDTIYNNIAYGVPGAHVEQVINAADVANAHEFIARQPDAYDSMLGERGVGLSGGEKQRISIARAVLMNPSILIFDEATAAVDSETENLIQEAIERLISGRTTLMIAHRLSTLRKANKIIVVDQGRIIECGSHDELMALGGKYHRLIEIQSMSEKLRKSKEEERFD